MAFVLGILSIAAGLLHGVGSHRAARSISGLSFLNVYGGAIGGILLGLTLCGMAAWRSTASSGNDPAIALFDVALVGTVIVSVLVILLLGFLGLLLLTERATLTHKDDSRGA